MSSHMRGIDTAALPAAAGQAPVAAQRYGVPERGRRGRERRGRQIMTVRAARSIEEYLQQLRAALGGVDAALIREALQAAEEHLRLEVAASRDRPEGEVLALITSTYGAPEDVAAVYQAAAE
jgi:hypothetical protein